MLNWYIGKHPEYTIDYLRLEKWKGNSYNAIHEMSYEEQKDKLTNDYGVKDFSKIYAEKDTFDVKFNKCKEKYNEIDTSFNAVKDTTIVKESLEEYRKFSNQNTKEFKHFVKKHNGDVDEAEIDLLQTVLSYKTGSSQTNIKRNTNETAHEFCARLFREWKITKERINIIENNKELKAQFEKFKTNNPAPENQDYDEKLFFDLLNKKFGSDDIQYQLRQSIGYLKCLNLQDEYKTLKLKLTSTKDLLGIDINSDLSQFDKRLHTTELNKTKDNTDFYNQSIILEESINRLKETEKTFTGSQLLTQELAKQTEYSVDKKYNDVYDLIKEFGTDIQTCYDNLRYHNCKNKFKQLTQHDFDEKDSSFTGDLNTKSNQIDNFCRDFQHYVGHSEFHRLFTIYQGKDNKFEDNGDNELKTEIDCCKRFKADVAKCVLHLEFIITKHKY